jgi:hypothetical protein
MVSLNTLYAAVLRSGSVVVAMRSPTAADAREI